MKFRMAIVSQNFVNRKFYIFCFIFLSLFDSRIYYVLLCWFMQIYMACTLPSLCVSFLNFMYNIVGEVELVSPGIFLHAYQK